MMQVDAGEAKGCQTQLPNDDLKDSNKKNPAWLDGYFLWD